jgi:hypothetical protein
MAVLMWCERNQNEGKDRAKKVHTCDEYLQNAVKWEAYVLDARVGMKLGTAVETLRVYKTQWNLS